MHFTSQITFYSRCYCYSTSKNRNRCSVPFHLKLITAVPVFKPLQFYPFNWRFCIQSVCLISYQTILDFYLHKEKIGFWKVSITICVIVYLSNGFVSGNKQINYFVLIWKRIDWILLRLFHIFTCWHFNLLIKFKLIIYFCCWRFGIPFDFCNFINKILLC